MTKPINIRIDDSMDARVDRAAEKSGLPKADVMRTALSLGLKDLELMDYDIEGAIFDRVQKVKSQSLPDSAKDRKAKHA